MRRRQSLALLTLALLNGCIAPYQIKTGLTPSFNPCDYKTYTFTPPEDQTLTHWLADPKHRKTLEDLLRASLKEKGLTEASGTVAPDLWIRHRLKSSFNAATQTTEGVVMAGDYKFAQWSVDLVSTKDSTAVWSLQMNMVIGDIEKHNLSNAEEGLRSTFVDYPACKKP